MHCILQAAAVYSYTTSAASHYVTSEKRGGIKCGACPQKQGIKCSKWISSHAEENIPTACRKNGHPRRAGPFANPSNRSSRVTSAQYFGGSPIHLDRPNQFRQKTCANTVTLCLAFSFTLSSPAPGVLQTCKAWQMFGQGRKNGISKSAFEPSLTETT